MLVHVFQKCVFRNICVCVHLSVQPFTKNIIFQLTETGKFGGKTAIPAEAEGSGHQANSLGKKVAESLRCLPDEVGSQAPKRKLYQVVPRYLNPCPTWVPGHLHGLSVTARERTSESIGLAQSTEMSAKEAIIIILNLSRLCALLHVWVLSCVLSALMCSECIDPAYGSSRPNRDSVNCGRRCLLLPLYFPSGVSPLEIKSYTWADLRVAHSYWL